MPSDTDRHDKSEATKSTDPDTSPATYGWAIPKPKRFFPAKLEAKGVRLLSDEEILAGLDEDTTCGAEEPEEDEDSLYMN